jgi:protein-disulfide isomerase
MSPSEKLDRYAIIATVCCTVLLTGLGVTRFLGYGPSSTTRDSAKAVRISNWDQVLAGGHRIGDSAAKVTVVEFADFECPSCQYFERMFMPEIRAKFGSHVAFVYRHFPLSYHKLAKPYAIAAECAGEQERFWQFHDLVYAQADSMGLKSIEAFAEEAGVDLQRFAKCRAAPTPVARITRDMEEAKRIKVTGTPTLVINGVKLGADSDVMTEVRSALARPY